jgi:hypothetical protein
MPKAGICNSGQWCRSYYSICNSAVVTAGTAAGIRCEIKWRAKVAEDLLAWQQHHVTLVFMLPLLLLLCGSVQRLDVSEARRWLAGQGVNLP